MEKQNNFGGMNEVSVVTDEILNLSADQLDALREIGNVGAGNSATALSQIINRKIDMSVPKVAIMPLGDVPDVVGGPDAMVVGVFLRVYGLAPGSVLFLLPRDSAFYLIDMLMAKERGSTKNLDFMDESALMEIGNILAGSYLNALSYFTKLTLLPSIPALALDMAGAILSVVLVQLGQMGDHALVIETEFLSEDDGIRGHFFLIPDPGSLNTILSAVGVK
uniref:chemotaxis protein CheC n=1 Tax=Massilibacillus massiliensis TaxID=1806837 RepID=UPI0018FED581|nr:chemotaxis protein CheC [Massilibacillus massiliensis]